MKYNLKIVLAFFFLFDFFGRAREKTAEAIFTRDSSRNVVLHHEVPFGGRISPPKFFHPIFPPNPFLGPPQPKRPKNQLRATFASNSSNDSARGTIHGNGGNFPQLPQFTPILPQNCPNFATRAFSMVWSLERCKQSKSVMHVSDRPRDASITLIVKHRVGALKTPNFHPKVPQMGPNAIQWRH